LSEKGVAEATPLVIAHGKWMDAWARGTQGGIKLTIRSRGGSA